MHFSRIYASLSLTIVATIVRLRVFPSSKLCSNCGAIHKHLTLADRTYVCPSCGFTIDRDINAAINLREKMKKTLVGGVTAEFMRVDPHSLNEDLAINQVKAMAYEA